MDSFSEAIHRGAAYEALDPVCRAMVGALAQTRPWASAISPRNSLPAKHSQEYTLGGARFYGISEPPPE
jgi:hypothetical protein